jgi:hypothetical protein
MEAGIPGAGWGTIAIDKRPPHRHLLIMKRRNVIQAIASLVLLFMLVASLSALAEVRLRITNVFSTNSLTFVGFVATGTQTNHLYWNLISTNLASTNWTIVGTFNGTGGDVAFTNSVNQPRPRAFFRSFDVTIATNQ